ncbi:MAG: aminotransferase class V-fold PLP-dependent enzyme [Acidobacteria bacterium]|nr:aminotransferase class V-fold PLP-dependent enzyme [Acidobacteriota bacterium]
MTKPSDFRPAIEDRSLELDAAAMRRLADAALERAIRHIESLPEQPAYVDTTEAIATSLDLIEPLPQGPSPLPELLDEIFDVHAPASYTTAGPGYLAYVPGGGLFQTAVADLISSSINRYSGVLSAAPGLVQLETNVIRWFGEIVGYPAGSSGFLASGGSLANLTAVVAARVDKLGEQFLDGTIYVSDQVHHCVAKAARIAGIPQANLKILPTDQRFRLDPAAVEAAIVEDLARGCRPFLLVASAGTTNSGAVDPLSELAEVAERHGLWYHVDGAYGGFFALTERGRRALAGIERADSIVLDPHKGLFLPYGTGALLVKDKAVLEAVHSQGAEYMPRLQADPELVDPCEISPELSRPYRGLRVWLPFKLHGIEPFRRNLDEKLDLTLWITEKLRPLPQIEILAEPQLSTLAFAVRATSGSEADTEGLTRALHAAILRRQRVHLTTTRLRGRYAIRICVLSFRTHLDRMEACLEDIEAGLAELPAGA